MVLVCCDCTCNWFKRHILNYCLLRKKGEWKKKSVCACMHVCKREGGWEWKREGVKEGGREWKREGVKEGVSERGWETERQRDREREREGERKGGREKQREREKEREREGERKRGREVEREGEGDRKERDVLWALPVANLVWHVFIELHPSYL